MSNYYDIYTTISLNPETQKPLNTICEFLQCPVQMEPLEKALWKKGNRIQNPGAFPFDDETGKIYDVLWKAAESENYSTLTRIGRWLVKSICPPASDEGMAAFHRKAHDPEEDENEYPQPKPKPVQPKPEVSVVEETKTNDEQTQENDSVLQPIEPIQDEDDENVIVIETRTTSSNDGAVRRSKKND